MKRLILAVALSLPIAGHSAPVGIPTADVGAFAQRLVEFTANVERWRSALRDAASTVRTLDATYEAFNGITNLHDVMRLPLLTRYLPDDYLSIYNDAMQLGLGSLFGESLDLYNVGLIRDVCLLVKAGAEKTNCEARQAAPYAYQATVNTIYKSVVDRTAHIEDLTNKLTNAATPQEKLDIGNLINAEIGHIQNESIRADALRMARDANREVIEQKQRQMAEEIWEVRQGVPLEPVGFD